MSRVGSRGFQISRVGSGRVENISNLTLRVKSIQDIQFSRVASGRVRRFSNFTGRVGSGRVGSGVFQISRVGSDRVRKFPNVTGRIGSGRIGRFPNSRVGWGQVKTSKPKSGSGRVS